MLKKAERASQGYHGRKDVNRYDRPKKLQATSHLWVRMHMQFGFQVLCMYHAFFFQKYFGNGCFSIVSEFLGLASRESYGKEILKQLIADIR